MSATRVIDRPELRALSPIGEVERLERELAAMTAAKLEGGGVNYPNARDCEHGRQRGKCADCDVARLERELAEARAALRFIAEFGGKIVEHEDYDGLPPTNCDGDWCADQARAALEGGA